MPTWTQLGFARKVMPYGAQCMICRKYKKCNEVKVVRYGKNPSEMRISWWVCSPCWNQSNNGLVVYNP